MRIGTLEVRPFVVTLQELPEKERFIMQHFKERGIECEAFNGIHGETSGFRTVHPYEVDAPKSGWNIGMKPVATWLSFHTLYAAANVLPDSHFWFLEWDCCFPDNWRQRVEAALVHTPQDFDVLFVGSCCTGDRQKQHIGGEVFTVNPAPLCGHSLIVAKKAIPTILRTQRKCYAPWDLSLMFHSLPLLKVFVILPRVCTQFNTEIPP